MTMYSVNLSFTDHLACLPLAAGESERRLHCYMNFIVVLAHIHKKPYRRLSVFGTFY